MSVPFPVLVGLGEVVRHPGWIRCFAAVRAGLDAGSPVVLAGPSGLGKSLLLSALQQALTEEGLTVVALPGRDIAPNRQPDVVLLDEADRVPPALLKHLLGGGTRCVLAGPRTLVATLESLGVPSLLVEMRPLPPGQVGPYLLEQIERAGLPDALLGPGTLDALARLGQGNPRRLQQLASRALFRAWIDDVEQVSPAHVADAAAQDEPTAAAAAVEPAGDVTGARPITPALPLVSASALSPAHATHTASSRRPARPWIALSGGAALCAAMLAVLLWQGGPAPLVSQPDPAPPRAEVDVAPAPVPLPDVALAPHHEAVQAPTPTAVRPEPPALVETAPLTEAAASPPPAASDTPAPVPPALPMPRPATTPVHVSVSFPPSNVAAGSRGVSLVASLNAAGLESVLVVGPATEAGAGIRYFYPSDQAAAAQVARQVGDAGRERLTAFQGAAPRPGTIQVVLPSKPGDGMPMNRTKSSDERKVQ